MISEDLIQQTISRILQREGAGSDDVDDRGGTTRFGITQPFATQWSIPWPPTVQDAREGYRRMLTGTKIDQIPDAATLDLVADCAVSHGSGKAIRWLQQALGATADGVIGPQTLKSIQQQDDITWPGILKSILASRFRYYAAIVVNDPSQLKFLQGWISRCCEFLA